MGLIEDITKSWFGSAIVGVEVVLVAPAVLQALGSGARPLAKAAVRDGLFMYDRAKETIAETGEQLSDIVAEVRAEIEDVERDTPSTRNGTGTTINDKP